MKTILILLNIMRFLAQDDYYVSNVQCKAYFYPSMKRVSTGDVVKLTDSIVFENVKDVIAVISPTKGRKYIFAKKKAVSPDIPGILVKVGDNIFPKTMPMRLAGSGLNNFSGILIPIGLSEVEPVVSIDDLKKKLKFISSRQVDSNTVRYVDSLNINLSQRFRKVRADSVFMLRYTEYSQARFEKSIPTTVSMNGLEESLIIRPGLIADPENPNLKFDLYYGKVSDPNAKFIYSFQLIPVEKDLLKKEANLLKTYLIPFYNQSKITPKQQRGRLVLEVQHELNGNYGYFSRKHIEDLLK